MSVLYLDNAATSPVRAEALEAMVPYLTRWFGNPSSVHTAGETAAAGLDDARGRVAATLGMRRNDIVFTSGGTEANNLAVKGIAIAAIARGARRIVTTPIEHESVLESASYLERIHGFDVDLLPVDGAGRVDPDTLDRFLASSAAETALVSVGFANNEVGTVQDAAALARVARRHRLPLHLDAVQAAGWLDLRAPTRGESGVAAISIAGHKIGAPKGTGVLAIRGRIPVEALLHGGGQEGGRRSGTQDVAGAVGFATALELAESEREASAVRVSALRDDFVAQVARLVPHAVLTGSREHRLPGSASFVFPGTSGEAILLELERRGIVSSSGSACAAGSDEPSHVLTALGFGADVARTAVRFTFPTSLDVSLEPVAQALAAAVATVGSGS